MNIKDMTSNKSIIGLSLCIIGLSAFLIYQIQIEPTLTKQKIHDRVMEMLKTNQTYDRTLNATNYIDGVGHVSFMFYGGRMHHGSMNFQDENGMILCCNSERNYQYFKEIMGDPLNES